MKKVSLFMLAALLLICGTTLFTSCESASDNPVPTPTPEPMAKQILGEWIVEMNVDGIEPIGANDKIEIPKGANSFALIYNFQDNGRGWKEMNIMKDGEPIYVPYDRYSCNFTYTIDEQGNVVATFLDEDDQPTEESDQLILSNGVLTIDDAKLVHATEEQIKKYKEMAESWHGGSDERKHSVTGINIEGWKWVNEHPATEQER